MKILTVSSCAVIYVHLDMKQRHNITTLNVVRGGSALLPNTVL